MKRHALTVWLLLLSSALLFGQGQPTNQVQGPTTNNFVMYYDLGSTPQYICYAQSLQPPASFFKSSSTLTSIAVATNVATINFSSTSYLLNKTIWAILVTQYASTNPLTKYWAGTPSVTPQMNLACSNRSKY